MIHYDLVEVNLMQENYGLKGSLDEFWESQAKEIKKNFQSFPNNLTWIESSSTVQIVFCRLVHKQ